MWGRITSGPAADGWPFHEVEAVPGPDGFADWQPKPGGLAGTAIEINGLDTPSNKVVWLHELPDGRYGFGSSSIARTREA
jgi:hypothetical protein